MFRATTPARGLVTAAGLATAVAAAAATSACRDVTAPRQDPTTVKYSDSLVALLGLNIATFTRDTSGVYYKDVAVGSGTVVTKGATVAYYYTGYLPDGRQFATNTNLTSPLTCVVGSGGCLLRGFDRGMIGMHAGSRRTVIVPPDLGYGDQTQVTAVPAGSVLIYVVDVPTVTPPTTTTTARAPR